MTGASTHVGELVREMRISAGLTQEQLAVAAGVTAKTLRGVEAGIGQPQRGTLLGIARALGLDETYLLHDGNDARPLDHRGKSHAPDTAAVEGSAGRAHLEVSR